MIVAPPVVEPTPDLIAPAAVELARTAAVDAAAGEAAGSGVGEHQGFDVEPGQPGEQVVTHRFASTSRAYVGWSWAVTIVRAEDSDALTVDEVVLLPGAGALVAPSWVPWSERVQPGDLSPGDLLPAGPDDERLVPAYTDSDADLADEFYVELGLGRARVLSADGRTDAAERWWAGDPGPFSALAKSAPGNCVDCGFLVPLAGSLRAAFGVCANAMAPDDGRVVALTHGCGAHSEAAAEPPVLLPTATELDDEFEIEVEIERETTVDLAPESTVDVGVETAVDVSAGTAVEAGSGTAVDAGSQAASNPQLDTESEIGPDTAPAVAPDTASDGAPTDERD